MAPLRKETHDRSDDCAYKRHFGTAPRCVPCCPQEIKDPPRISVRLEVFSVHRQQSSLSAAARPDWLFTLCVSAVEIRPSCRARVFPLCVEILVFGAWAAAAAAFMQVDLQESEGAHLLR